MFQLVQTIWLWALAALVVPVIIHLWNTREGKTLKVGSIALYSETARAHAKSFRVSELLLLLLRCLLIAVLVLLLARPFWIKQQNLAKDKGWILVHQNEVQRAYKSYPAVIDSLLDAGHRFHYFNMGFEEETFSEALLARPDSTLNSSHSYWDLLTELNQKVPPSLPVHVFTNNSLRNFRGVRPTVNLTLTWYTYAEQDTAVTWIEKAYETIDDSIRVVVGNSNPEGSWYTYRTLSNHQTDPELEFNVDKGKLSVSLVQSKSVPTERVVVDTSSFSIAIYHNNYPEDASYIRAALEAIRDVTRRKITVMVTRTLATIPAKRDWLFWLSEEAVDPLFLKNKVLVYRNGVSEKRRSTIVTGDQQHGSAGMPLSSYVQIKGDSSHTDEEVLWSNGFGEPILSRKKMAAAVYSLSGRFNPRWNELPWSSQFPQVIYDLVFGESNNEMVTGATDIRKVEDRQVYPVKTTTDVFARKALLNRTDLAPLFWVIAFTLFLLERIMVYTSKTTKANG